MRLKDKVAIVTGGGGGLGKGISFCMATEGAHVVVSDWKMDLAEAVAAKVKDTGQKSLAVYTDVRMSDQVQNLMETTISSMGRIDILVCCAGVMGYDLRGEESEEPLTFENISEEDWDLTIDVNLKGVFLCNRAVVPYFIKQRNGKIINVSSVAGRQGNEILVHYAASKAGVINFTQGVAKYMARYNVNVNTICPGIIYTPMWARGARIMAKAHPAFKDTGISPEEAFKAIVQSMIPFGREQTAEDIGRAAVFLASEEAKEITGQALNVCGGMAFD